MRRWWPPSSPDWPPHFMPSLLCLHDVCSFPLLGFGFFQKGKIAAPGVAKRSYQIGIIVTKQEPPAEPTDRPTAKWLLPAKWYSVPYQVNQRDDVGRDDVFIVEVKGEELRTLQDQQPDRRRRGTQEIFPECEEVESRSTGGSASEGREGPVLRVEGDQRGRRVDHLQVLRGEAKGGRTQA